MEKGRAKELFIGLVEQFIIKDLGMMISVLVLVLLCGQMEENILENGLTQNVPEKDNFIGPMVIFMKAIG